VSFAHLHFLLVEAEAAFFSMCDVSFPVKRFTGQMQKSTGAWQTSQMLTDMTMLVRLF
jgi:hypothetical protein